MTGAMYAAVAGLRAHMSALNVIGQNISNVNTNAYKSTRYTFLEALYTTVRGGSDGTAMLGGKNPAQNGYGSSIGTIDLDMSTKNYTPTGRATDVMIDGDGFLLVGDKNQTFQTLDDVKSLNLTRLGNLEFDSQGYLVDGQGQVVYGFLSVENPIYAKVVAADKAVEDRENPIDNADIIMDWDVALAYYKADPQAMSYDQIMAHRYFWDKDGQMVEVTNSGTADNPIFKTKVIDKYTPAPTLTAIRKPMAAERQVERIPIEDENGDPVVDADGNPTYKEVEIVKRGDAVYPTYDPDTGEIKDVEDAALITGERVNLESISIDENTGRISATTKNGDAIVIGSIAIAQVDNPNGVTHVDGHYYKALEGAGSLRLTSIGFSVKNSNDPESPFYDIPRDEDGNPIPGQEPTRKTFEPPIESAGGTKLISGGLESSGTDLATEISNMIMIQRGYQANTRIVTVTDSMLEELVNMKR